MPELFKRDFTLGWYPSADALNGPQNCLLRADNLEFDERDVPSLRAGSSKIHGPLNPNPPSAADDIDVHFVYSALVGGAKHRFYVADNDAGGSNNLYVDGSYVATLGAVTEDVAGDDGFGYTFIAAGATKKKHNGSAISNWGIARPATRPSVARVESITKTVATFAQADAEFTAEEGTLAYTTGQDGVASAAVTLTPAITVTRGTLVKTWSVDQDVFTIGGMQGQATDLFDMYMLSDAPHLMDTVTIMFGLGTGGDPFKDDYFYFDFKLGGARANVVDVKAARTIEDEIRTKVHELATTVSTDRLPPRNFKEILEGRVNDSEIRRIRERKDKRNIAANWFHLSVPRGQFNRVGSTQGRNWATIRGFKIVYKSVSGTDNVHFDDAKWYGGGDRVLNGAFRFRCRFANTNAGTYTEKSPPSDPSNEVIFDQETPRITIPAAVLAAADAQANEVWIYMYGGYMDTYYRVAVAGVVVDGTVESAQWSINEFPRYPYNPSSEADRALHASFGFGLPGATSGLDLNVDLVTSEIQAMVDNEVLEYGTDVPPDNIIGIAGPVGSRMFVLTNKALLYPSERGNPGLFRSTSALKIGDGASSGTPNETPYWVIDTIGGLYVGTAGDIYRVEGGGEELEDGSLNFAIRRLHVGWPPVDKCVTREGNAIYYRAADGLRVFTGEGSIPLSREPVELLWRSQARHGVSAINATGSTARFRAATARGILSVIVPEGSDAASSVRLHRYDVTRQRWYRHVYPQAFRSIFREPDGLLIAGGVDGKVYQLDTGTQDEGVNIPVTLWTPADDGGAPLHRKHLWDFLMDFDSGGQIVTINMHADGSGSSAAVWTTSGSGPALYKRDLNPLGPYRRLQYRITGSFQTFYLYDMATAYRILPRTRMHWDSGFIPAPKGQDIAWVREIRVCVNTPNDLTVTPFYEDGAGTARMLSVGSLAGKTAIFTIPLGREDRGILPRIKIQATNAAGTGEVGFELYWLEMRLHSTGNETEKDRIRIPVES